VFIEQMSQQEVDEEFQEDLTRGRVIMRRSGAFFLAFIFVLWITPSVFAADNGNADGAQPAAVATPDAQPATPADPTDTTTAAPAKKPAPAPEQVFSINQVEVFWTAAAKPDAVFGYGTSTHDLGTVQFEHFSFHRWGEIYLDAEGYQGHNVGAPFSMGNDWQSLLVFNPYLSLAKITKQKKFGFGPITDVQLVSRFERESYPDTPHFYTRNFGPTFVFKAPGFAWFESGLLERWDNINRKETYLWRSVVLSNGWKVGGEKFHYNLLSLINGTRGNGTSIFERNDFLWELHGVQHVQLGMRLEIENYAHDPIEAVYDGIDKRYMRVMPEIMGKYIF
jgi:hypothetical protein